MIHVSGPAGTAELDAANALALALRTEWPWVDEDTETSVYLMACVKCFGQSPEDLDIVLFAQFGSGARFRTGFPAMMPDGTVYVPEEVSVKSLALVIEVKDHDPRGVLIEGSAVTVFYNNDGVRKAEAVTEKNARQVHSLLGYIRACRFATPFVENLIWLRNFPTVDLPRIPHNILGHRVTWLSVMERVYCATPKTATPRVFCIDHFRQLGGQPVEALSHRMTEQIRPTQIDRAKMDRVAATDQLGSWAGFLGERQIILRGRGGSGKTVVMLQMAYHAYLKSARRSLVLTYNRALVADLQRLLSFLGVSDPYEQSCVAVRTIDSFLREAMVALGAAKAHEERFYDRLSELKREFAELFEAGVLNDADVARLRRQSPEAFDFDLVFVDEAQDWPEVERQLLRRFFPPNATVVADGVDQFVRSRALCNWAAGLNRSDIERVPLESCLRMKRNLVEFCNAVAEGLELGDWSLSPHESLPGGRVIVTVGPGHLALDQIGSLLERAADLGNEPIDSLVCVPPSWSTHLGGRAAESLRNQGCEVWDLTLPEERGASPLSSKELRVVQYESCRGLEGWTTLCLELDTFYELKLDESSSDRGGRVHAGRWAMIPLTRAMDTLSVNIADRESAMGLAVLNAARQRPDAVEIHDISQGPEARP